MWIISFTDERISKKGIMKMNSNRTFSISKSHCNYCHKEFYEFKHDELNKCPNCDTEFDNKGDCYIEENVGVEIEVDSKTGKLNISLQII